MTKVTNELARFEHDLGKGWKMVHLVDSEGTEIMRFTDGNNHTITLGSESVKKLRDIFRK